MQYRVLVADMIIKVRNVSIRKTLLVLLASVILVEHAFHWVYIHSLIHCHLHSTHHLLPNEEAHRDTQQSPAYIRFYQLPPRKLDHFPWHTFSRKIVIHLSMPSYLPIIDRLLCTLMRDCFQYGQYGELDPHQRPSNHPHIDIGDFKVDGALMNSCDAVQKRLDALSQLLPDNSVVFHTGFTFPFLDIEDHRKIAVHQYPDILKLVEWAQSARPFPFDLRLIVLKRRQWTTALMSSVSRYCGKTERVHFMKLMLTEIQREIVQIDPQFWILVDFDDLLENTMDYAPIFAQYFFQMESAEMERRMIDILQMTMDKKPDRNYADSPCALTESEVIELRKYLRLDSLNEWPLFKADKFIVSPWNSAFLDQKWFIKRD